MTWRIADQDIDTASVTALVQPKSLGTERTIRGQLISILHGLQRRHVLGADLPIYKFTLRFFGDALLRTRRVSQIRFLMESNNVWRFEAPPSPNPVYFNNGLKFVDLSLLRTKVVYDYALEYLELQVEAIEGDPADNFVNDGVPVGIVVDFSGTEAQVPSGWLPCDGRTVSAATYPELVALIGPVLPDSRGRMVAGKDVSGPWSILWETGGAKQHRHATPASVSTAAGAHDHGGVTGAGGAHDHTGLTGGGTGSTGAAGSHNHGGQTGPPSANVASAIIGLLTTAPTTTHTHAITTQADHTHTLASHFHSITAAPTHTHTIPAAPDHVHSIAAGTTGPADPAYIVFNRIIKALSFAEFTPGTAVPVAAINVNVGVTVRDGSPDRTIGYAVGVTASRGVGDEALNYTIGVGVVRSVAP